MNFFFDFSSKGRKNVKSVQEFLWKLYYAMEFWISPWKLLSRLWNFDLTRAREGDRRHSACISWIWHSWNVYSLEKWRFPSYFARGKKGSKFQLLLQRISREFQFKTTLIWRILLQNILLTLTSSSGDFIYSADFISSKLIWKLR